MVEGLSVKRDIDDVAAVTVGARNAPLARIPG
jgi:hypothetical protein